MKSKQHQFNFRNFEVQELFVKLLEQQQKESQKNIFKGFQVSNMKREQR